VLKSWCYITCEERELARKRRRARENFFSARVYAQRKRGKRIMSLATKMGYIYICSKIRRGWGLKYFEIVYTY